MVEDNPHTEHAQEMHTIVPSKEIPPIGITTNYASSNIITSVGLSHRTSRGEINSNCRSIFTPDTNPDTYKFPNNLSSVPVETSFLKKITWPTPLKYAGDQQPTQIRNTLRITSIML